MLRNGDGIKVKMFANAVKYFKLYIKRETRKSISIVFANGSGDQGSIPGRVIKTQKMVLDAALLNTQRCKVRIKGEVEQSREWSSALPYTLV